MTERENLPFNAQYPYIGILDKLQIPLDSPVPNAPEVSLDNLHILTEERALNQLTKYAGMVGVAIEARAIRLTEEDAKKALFRDENIMGKSDQEKTFIIYNIAENIPKLFLDQKGPLLLEEIAILGRLIAQRRLAKHSRGSLNELLREERGRLLELAKQYPTAQTILERFPTAILMPNELQLSLDIS